MTAQAAQYPMTMTEIRYEDREEGQAAYPSRVLILADRLRLDFGDDGEDFILFDQRAGKVWHVGREARRILVIVAETPRFTWPSDWSLKLDSMPSADNLISRLWVNGQLCLEYKNDPGLREDAGIMAEFRRALAGNHARTWEATPEDLRDPCTLATEVREAGVEYRDGLLLAARFWDGRVRVFQNRQSLPARPDLFQLPAGFVTLQIGAARTTDETQGRTGNQPAVNKGKGAGGKGKARQPASSQRK